MFKTLLLLIKLRLAGIKAKPSYNYNYKCTLCGNNEFLISEDSCMICEEIMADEACFDNYIGE